ncbi:MAG: hypothetical protein OEZ18_03165 [Candidatus Bathyarchaeota archaeon]|nr:hypothetical protein [Candidatus Bathyarchaeota archaeon]
MKKTSKAITNIAVFCLVLSLISFFGFEQPSVNAMTSSYFTATEVKFVVYPDGTVGLSSRYNYTSEYPNTGPTVYASAQVTKNGGMYGISIDSTLTLPSQEASSFPFNATKASISDKYSNEILSTDVNASLTLPDQWYSGGTMFDFLSFPFNSTDLTISGEYSNRAYNGTIAIHAVPGLALGEVEVHFEGNTTEIIINDSITVFYNLPLPIPGFTPLNETYLNNLLQMLNSTIPGQGQGSLYNMTSGMLACPTFNTTLTPIENGAEISFLAIIRGDFIDTLAKMLAGMPKSMLLGPESLGSLVPIYSFPNATIIYNMFNATLHSVKSGEFTMSYSKAAKKLDFQATLKQNLEEYENATIQMMSVMYTPEFRPYIESLMNTTYCSTHSYNETITYNNGQMNYEADYALEGDLNAQINHVKNVYIDMLNVTSPSLGPESLITTLKDTTVDISNLQLNINISDYSVLWNFEGVKVAPPADRINATCFRLERFFNVTSSPYGESPRENERMRLIVQGGNNGTHTVTLFIDPTDPDRVPDPDEFAGENTMIWNNQSISKLERLIFKVFEGYAETIYNSASVTQSNPLKINAKETAGCMLTLTNISKPAAICIKNVTAPLEVNPPPGTYKVLGNYIQITADAEDVAVNVTIRIYYTDEQLSNAGLDENSLKILYWDEAANDWVVINTQINTTEHYVWATVNHLSIWALMGQPSPAPWEQPWFLPSIVIIVAVVLISIAVVFLKKKKQPPQAKENSGQ